MKNFLNKKTLIIASIITAVMLLLTFINTFLTQNTPPKLLSSSPINNAINVDHFVQPTLTFDSPIFADDFKLTSTPPKDMVVTQTDNRTLLIKIDKPLLPSTKYTLALSWKNKSTYSLTFNTMQSQTDFEVLENIKTAIDRDYPLAKFTPYVTSLYRVVYDSPMTLGIELKNFNITSQEAIEEVKAWVKRNGGDVDAHKYIIIEPSNLPSPTP